MYKLPVYLRLHVPATVFPLPFMDLRLHIAFQVYMTSLHTHSYVGGSLASCELGDRKPLTHIHKLMVQAWEQFREVHFNMLSAGVGNWTTNPPIDGAHWSTAAPTFWVHNYYYPSLQMCTHSYWSLVWATPTVRNYSKTKCLKTHDCVHLTQIFYYNDEPVWNESCHFRGDPEPNNTAGYVCQNSTKKFIKTKTKGSETSVFDSKPLLAWNIVLFQI